MRRRLLTAAIFMLVGTVVNVAVAWGLAIWGPFGFKGGPEGYTISDGEVGWWLTRYDWIGANRLISRRAAVGTWTEIKAQAASGVVRPWEPPRWDAPPADELLVPWGQIRESSVLCGLGEYEYLTDDARGWPLRSMWCSWGTPDVWSRLPPFLWYVPASPLSPGPLSHGIPLQTRKGPSSRPWIRAIPLAIWPPGFAVNTLCYTAVLWLLIPGPFVLRRFIRVKRGLCPACAYPVGEAAVCSECGKALPGRAKVAM